MIGHHAHLFKRKGRFTSLSSSIFNAKAALFYSAHANRMWNYPQEQCAMQYFEEYITFLKLLWFARLYTIHILVLE